MFSEEEVFILKKLALLLSLLIVISVFPVESLAIVQNTSNTLNKGTTSTAKPTATSTIKPTAKPTATPTVKATAKATSTPTPTFKPTAKVTAAPISTIKPTVKPASTSTLMAKVKLTVKPMTIKTPTIKATAKPTPTVKPKPPTILIVKSTTMPKELSSAPIVKEYIPKANEVIAEDQIALKDIIKNNLMNRIPIYTVVLKIDPSKKFADAIFAIKTNAILEEIYKTDDYLRWATYSYECGMTSIPNYPSYAQLTFKMTYFLTKTKETELDSRVAQEVAKLNLNNMSEYEKIKTIHDYIVNTVSYKESVRTSFTGYGALIDKEAVCQGYSLLYYKMLLKVGINNKLIWGKGNNANHMWNLVQLNGKYYHVDTTWDDVNATTPYYNNFLKSDSFILSHGHTWDKTLFPAADENYTLLP